MRIDAKAEYYVGEPTFPDSTTRAVFGDPALRPAEDWGWIQPANRTFTDKHVGPDLSHPLIQNITGYSRPGFADQQSEKNKPYSETAAKLSALQTELMQMKESLGRQFRKSEEVQRLRIEYDELVRIRRKEKRRGGEF